MDQPKVSILMAVYNASPFLDEAIGSVLLQKYENWELICVNDGSTDNSLEILQKYDQQYVNIKVIDQANAGISNARDAALKISTGKYVSILDADDKLSDDYLQETVCVALQHPENDCVIPELYRWHWRDETKSHSCTEISSVPENCDGIMALGLSIPWRIHALALWNGDMLRGVGYRTDGYYISDEVSSRDFFAHSRRVVASKGRYYYRYNEQSITNTVSSRIIEKATTNLQLRQLGRQYNLPSREQVRINTQIFFELIGFVIYFLHNKHLFTLQERQRSLDIIKYAYRHRQISDVRPQNFAGKVKKYVLGYNYTLCMCVCWAVLKIKGNG